MRKRQNEEITLGFILTFALVTPMQDGEMSCMRKRQNEEITLGIILTLALVTPMQDGEMSCMRKRQNEEITLGIMLTLATPMQDGLCRPLPLGAKVHVYKVYPAAFVRDIYM